MKLSLNYPEFFLFNSMGPLYYLCKSSARIDCLKPVLEIAVACLVLKTAVTRHPFLTRMPGSYSWKLP